MTKKKAFTQEGRITSLHGIILPPKKKQVVDRYITLRLVITGIIPSKKNLIYASSNLPLLLGSLYAFKAVKECVDWLRKHLKPFVKNSARYEEWVQKIRPVVLRQAKAEEAKYAKWGIELPLDNVSIRVYHYWKDNSRRDNSNKYDTIVDLLVSCCILKDDTWQVVGKNESEAECYAGEILDHITTIDITQRISGAVSDASTSFDSLEPLPEESSHIDR